MERAVPTLPGDDIEIAKRFYVEALGFEVAFEPSADNKSGILGLQRGTIYFIVDCPMPGHGRQACVTLQVDSADAYYDEWKERADILRLPRNEPWGARTFDLIDPFGNTVFVVGPPL